MPDYINGEITGAIADTIGVDVFGGGLISDFMNVTIPCGTCQQYGDGATARCELYLVYAGTGRTDGGGYAVHGGLMQKL